MRLFSASIAALALTGLAACADRTDPQIINSAGYQAGYADGCTTGNQRVDGFRGTVTRDENRFENDENYRIGWRQGYTVCGGSQTDRQNNQQDYLFNDRFDSGPI